MTRGRLRAASLDREEPRKGLLVLQCNFDLGYGSWALRIAYLPYVPGETTFSNYDSEGTQYESTL